MRTGRAVTHQEGVRSMIERYADQLDPLVNRIFDPVQPTCREVAEVVPHVAHAADPFALDHPSQPQHAQECHHATTAWLVPDVPQHSR